MAKLKKKHQSGQATAFLSQKQAMRRLQLSLPNFRRLCILKGVYPVEPPSRKKVGKGNSQPRVYYYAKDIGFLAHEPLIKSFRSLRIHQMKVRKARERGDKDKEFRLRIHKPRYSLHEVVKERYPTRQDALRDISDSLNLLFLFARLPRLTQFNPALIGLSRRLCVEFMNYVIATKSICKAFISIKGFYIQAEIDGVPVVWIIPHVSATHSPTDVDYRILATCLEFDATLVGSLLCNLYRKSGLLYPPKLAVRVESDPTQNYSVQTDNYFEFLSSLSYPLKRTEEAEQDLTTIEDLTELQGLDDQVSEAVNQQMQRQKIRRLFEGKYFFLNREVPREVLCLIIRSCGGDCSWDATLYPGASYNVNDGRITYQIVDRPMNDMLVTRYYVQPQWVFDSINARRLLPPQDYLPACSLPPHLSPFADGGKHLEDVLGPLGIAKTPRGGLTGVAPGFGAGAALYRPPEADYLAGLVTLAELRGNTVKAQRESSVHPTDALLSLPEDQDIDEVDNSYEKDSNTKIKTKSTSRKKKTKKPGKGEKPLVIPGQIESSASKEMQHKAEQNAERKLQELLIAKKHKLVYKKMVHAIKRRDKEVRQLTEKRRIVDSKRK